MGRPTSAHPTSVPDDPPTRPAWAYYLIELRQRRGLTAREVAARMGVTQQTYAGIEAGTRTRNGRRNSITPKDDTLHRLAKALDLSPSERQHLFALVTTGAVDRRPWQTRLKFARIAASLTQDAAAQAAGVTAATYREWERRNSGAPRHEHLRRLLTHLGWTSDQVEEFMQTIPLDVPAARPPQQPTNPVDRLPQWSQFITRARLNAGMYLSQVDAIVGQQSIVRRFELGGWPRSDGRLSVPSISWLSRVADALNMSASDRAHLHLLADHQRVAVASQGGKPLPSELLHEARKAVDLTRSEADQRLGLPRGTWGKIESGNPTALARVDHQFLDHAISGLPIGSLLAAALRTAVPDGRESADNTDEAHPTETSTTTVA